MYTRSSGRKIVSARTCSVSSISCFFASLVSPDGPVMVTTGMVFLLRSRSASRHRAPDPSWCGQGSLERTGCRSGDAEIQRTAHADVVSSTVRNIDADGIEPFILLCVESDTKV